MDQRAAERLELALDLHDVGVDIMRNNLRRRHPDANSEEIESMLGRWLRERPGAVHGDGVGSAGRRRFG